MALLYANLLPQVQLEVATKSPFTVTEFERRFDIFMDAQFELTMGGLTSRLRNTGRLSVVFDAELAKAKELRNFLAHGYFRERAEQLISKVGRHSMMAELNTAQHLFEQVDEELKAAAKLFAQASQVDLSSQEQRVAEYIALAYAQAAALDVAAQA